MLIRHRPWAMMVYPSLSSGFGSTRDICHPSKMDRTVTGCIDGLGLEPGCKNFKHRRGLYTIVSWETDLSMCDLYRNVILPYTFCCCENACEWLKLYLFCHFYVEHCFQRYRILKKERNPLWNDDCRHSSVCLSFFAILWERKNCSKMTILSFFKVGFFRSPLFHGIWQSL